MRMKDIPWFNRPWTKIKRSGTKNLDDAELLALIFISGTKIGQQPYNAIELANILLKQRNFHHFHRLSLPQIKSIIGDEIKAYQIMAISEICKRYAKLQVKAFKTTIESSTDVYNYFCKDLTNKSKEHLYALLLNAKQKIISSVLISVGSLTQSVAHPREIFKPAIEHAAYSIILVHNHPSGDPSPSSEDLKITRQLTKAGSMLGIKVLDHIIIGENKYWSYLDAGVKEVD
jgi:DNA repair protein RadC